MTNIPTIKPVNIDDVVPGKTYVFGAPRIKSRDATLTNIFGKEMFNYRYSKTKGFFSAQLLIVQHYVNSHDTIAVHFDGQVLIDNREQLSSDKNFVLFEHSEFKAYTTYIFKDRAEVSEKYNNDWDEEVFNRNPSAIFDGDMSLPRHIARELKSLRDWQMYRNARENFKELMAA